MISREDAEAVLGRLAGSSTVGFHTALRNLGMTWKCRHCDTLCYSAEQLRCCSEFVYSADWFRPGDKMYIPMTTKPDRLVVLHSRINADMIRVASGFGPSPMLTEYRITTTRKIQMPTTLMAENEARHRIVENFTARLQKWYDDRAAQVAARFVSSDRGKGIWT